MRHSRKESKSGKPQSPGARALRLTGVITAGLSLFFGIYQLATIVSNARERGRHIEEVLLIGKALQGGGEYASAWTNFEDALKNAEQGGTIAKIAGELDAKQLKVRAAQEDLAMAWLRNIRSGSDEKFTDTVDRLMPVLLRGAARATGARKADLLAHVGWSYFLKSRDGMSQTAPDGSYREALAVDAGNPYAHVFWGHWLLWRHESVEEARKHFAAAIAANRDREYVRHLELAAFRNAASDTGDVEVLRVVNEMSRNNEPVDEQTRSNVYAGYFFGLNKDPGLRRFIAVVPADQQIELLRALFYDASFDPGRTAVREAAMAVLQEAAGHRAEALAGWKLVRAEFQGEDTGNLKVRADAEIRRLSK